MNKFKLIKCIFSFLISIFIVIFTVLGTSAAGITDFRLAEQPAADSKPPSQSELHSDNINPSPANVVPVITAGAAVVMDPERGQILYKTQQDKKLPSALANKIMTALLVIENSPLETIVTISKEASMVKDPSFNLEAGGKYSATELLYALMLVSSTQSANALGEYIGGNLSNFTDLMNKKASELGMKNTIFTNPSGHFDDNQYTTAYDISLLIKYALKNSTFRHYFFSTKAYPWLTELDSNILVNQNRLFWIYEGVAGGTLGYTDPSRQSSVTLAQKGERPLIVIILDCAQENVSNESIELFEYGYNNFKRDILVEKGKSLRTVRIEDNFVNLVSIENIYYTFPIGEDHIKSLEFLDKKFELPVLRNFALSTARYILKDDTIIDVQLYPDIEITAPTGIKSILMEKLTDYRDILILLLFLVFLECIIVIYKLGRFVKKLKTGRNQL